MGYNLNEPFTWREDLLKLSVNVVDIKNLYRILQWAKKPPSAMSYGLMVKKHRYLVR